MRFALRSIYTKCGSPLISAVVDVSPDQIIVSRSANVGVIGVLPTGLVPCKGMNGLFRPFPNPKPVLSYGQDRDLKQSPRMPKVMKAQAPQHKQPRP